MRHLLWPKQLPERCPAVLSELGARGFDHRGRRLPHRFREERRHAAQIVQRALDAGINFFDNAWEYHDGQSEEWLGRALGSRRKEAVLMTKVCTHGRDKKVAMQMLEESLRRCNTDHLDVWQIHEVIYDNDPEKIFAPNGAAEALLEAKKQGKVG